MVDVSILIVSYNTREMTVDCLRSVYDQTDGITFEVLVVDNKSEDGSTAAIAKEFPDVRLIDADDNLGFAKANNLAAQLATGKYLLLLNPDTVVLDSAIQKIYAFALSSPQNLVYGGRTLYGDMTLNPSSCWRQQSIWSLFCYSFGLTSLFRNSLLFDPEAYGGWQRDTVREVSIVSGCFLLIKRELWEALRGFDQTFFMYGEDADLCMRAMKLGARPVITPEVTIVHYGGASEKVRSDKMIRLFRAKEALLREHWAPVARELGYALYSAAVRMRVLVLTGLSLISAKRFRNTSQCWQEIWARREEWHRI